MDRFEDMKVALRGDDVLRVKRELNFLLWTQDPPSSAMVEFPFNRTEAYRGPNIQCVAHTVITSALLMRRGFRVTTRAGFAFLVEISPDGNHENDRLEQIGKHWWMTLDDYGLIDLSLSGENEHPLFFCNRSPGNGWHLEFSDSQRKLNAFLQARRQGCFYVTVKKHRPTAADLKQSLQQEFTPAKQAGISLSYANILTHIELLLEQKTLSLLGRSQTEAWGRLSEQ